MGACVKYVVKQEQVQDTHIEIQSKAEVCYQEEKKEKITLPLNTILFVIFCETRTILYCR